MNPIVAQNAVQILAESLAHAAYEGLPALDYDEVDLHALVGVSAQDRQALREREAAGESALPRRHVHRRPTVQECEVLSMFAQTWGSTALGFGGLGGAAMTRAYTCIVRGPGEVLAVYWSGRLGYLVDPKGQSATQRTALEKDLARQWTAPRREAVGRYGATLAGMA